MQEDGIIQNKKPDMKWGKMSAALLLIAVALALSFAVKEPG